MIFCALARRAIAQAALLLFALQDEYSHFTDAKPAFAQLRQTDENSELVAELAPRAMEIAALLEPAEAVTASATICNPCDCHAGEPLW